MKDAILLAGGLGTRLGPVSEGLPKPLMKVAGKPFVEHILNMLLDSGITRVIMAVGYRSELLRDYFGDTYAGMDIVWSVENSLLGTGGAIKLAYETFSLERAFILNADTLFRIDLRNLERLHVGSKAMLTIGLREVEDVSRYGAIELDYQQHIVTFEEKGGHGSGLVNGGVYILERSILDLPNLPLVFSFERDFLRVRLAHIQPLGVPSKGYFIDIGVPEDLERARRELQAEAS